MLRSDIPFLPLGPEFCLPLHIPVALVQSKELGRRKHQPTAVTYVSRYITVSRIRGFVVVISSDFCTQNFKSKGQNVPSLLGGKEITSLASKLGIMALIKLYLLSLKLL